MSFIINDSSRFRIVKKTHADGSVLFVVQMGTSRSKNVHCPDWGNFVDIVTRKTIEAAREDRDYLIDREVVLEEVVE